MRKNLLLMLMSLFCAIAINAQNDINNSFFEKVAYRGAFGTTTNWTSGWANWNPQNTTYGNPTVTVSGEITSNTTWTSGNVYLIQGFLYVRSGATLTIQPGTVIRGDKNSKGTLLIERGAKLMADGTSSNPIVFTSNESAGNRAYGDWGGVILCGKATINVAGGEAIIEGGPTSLYGGGANPDDNDNSGSLKYVRIEFPGIPFVPDKEINGLTFGGVGKSTQIDYIQVSYSGDDSYEWFGGTVNAKHLIAFRGWDDDFDTDYGFRGMIQFAVSLRDKDIADPGSGSNGFESDNDGTGSANTPVTKPIFSNVSIFGPKYESATAINSNYKRAMHLRRNTQINIYNSVLSGYPTGLFIDGTASQTNATNGDLKMQRVVISGMTNFFASDFERNFFKTASFGNDTVATNDLLGYVDPFNLTAPNFLLKSTSELKSGSIWPQVANKPIESSAAILIYPNPAKENITVAFDVVSACIASVKVFNSLGQMQMEISGIQCASGKNEIEMNVSNLQTGMYVLVAETESRIFTHKLIVR